MSGSGRVATSSKEQSRGKRVCVDRETTIAGASRVMRDFGVEELVVVDTRGGDAVPVGVMSARQIVTRIVATGLEPAVLTAGDIVWPETRGLEAEVGDPAVSEWLRARFGAATGDSPVLRAEPPYSGLPPHKLSRVKAFVDEHMADPISVRRLAATVHMSVYHFARMFKKATGDTPHAYITRLRMDRAKELLRDGSPPLADLAASVGFQTQSHFTEVFRRYAGVTPGRFRVAARHAHAANASPAEARQSRTTCRKLRPDAP